MRKITSIVCLLAAMLCVVGCQPEVPDDILVPEARGVAEEPITAAPETTDQEPAGPGDGSDEDPEGEGP